jgi:putative salt-induced outer membrane protein YdiY
MKIVRILCASLVGLGMAVNAAADVVLLKNGDRITGTFVSVRATTLNMQAAGLGNLAIPLGQVAALSVTNAVTLVARGQAARHGMLTLGASGAWQLIDDNGVTHTIELASVEVILPAAGYQSLVTHSARPWQDWNGIADLGYSIQRGNQQTNTFSSSVDARRERPPAPTFARHGRVNVHLTMLLSNAVEDETSIGSNTLSTSLRQDILFAPGNFVFGIMQFDHVGTEGLTLRQTYGGGSGYDVLLGKRGTLSLLGGLTFVREVFLTDGGQHTAQLLVGEKLRFQFTPRIRFDHTTNAYPNLTIPGQYHFDTRTAVDIKLTTRFALHTGLIDLYLTNPALGSERNNFSLTTGIGVTF